MGQSEANAVLLRVEQEALDHVRNSEISTHNLLAQSVKHAKLLNEEVDAKNTGLQIANLHGQQVQAEVARIELLLGQERATSQLSTQGWSKSHEAAVAAQTEYVQALREVDIWKNEHGEAMHMYQEESIQCHEEHRQNCETYYLYENLRSAPNNPSVNPPGLPVSPVVPAARPRRSMGIDEDEPPARDEEVALKTKKGENLHAPSYRNITGLVSWQTALTQQLVQTSGVRDIGLVIKWIAAVWAKGATFES